MRERSPQTVMAVALWSLVVVFLSLLFGGEQTPVCLALGDAAIAHARRVAPLSRHRPTS
jgi:hypothetical protein